jgi:nucleotide-binding universal stress UspA family protein
VRSISPSGTGARVTLVHVYQPLIAAIPDGLVLYSADQFADFHNKVAAQLDVAKADAERAGIANVETEVRQGAPHTEMVQFARDNAVDLIVMGSHGRTGLAHALVGSVAEKVVRKAPCPVLVVRGDH